MTIKHTLHHSSIRPFIRRKTKDFLQFVLPVARNVKFDMDGVNKGEIFPRICKIRKAPRAGALLKRECVAFTLNYALTFSSEYLLIADTLHAASGSLSFIE